MTKINVLVPVKNEEWILEAFLKTTSEFADNIILADQNSTDKTLEIAKSFSKVVIIKNDSSEFNEASRQQLLIETARKMFGLGNVLIALDADEIVAYNSLSSSEWDRIRCAEPGTVLFFEKPTFFGGFNKVIRYNNQGGWPLGFKDDGTIHNPKYIHSTRIPYREGAPKIYLNDIKFLHCNLLSLSRQRAKVRYYCILESLAKSKSWYYRITYYNKRYNYAKQEGDGLESADPNWTKQWLLNNVVFDKNDSSNYYWYDKESIKLLMRYGPRKFWMEDIWDVDWEVAKSHFKVSGPRITPPPFIVSLMRDILFYIIKGLFYIKKKVRK